METPRVVVGIAAVIVPDGRPPEMDGGVVSSTGFCTVNVTGGIEAEMFAAASVHTIAYAYDPTAGFENVCICVLLKGPNEAVAIDVVSV